MARIIQDSFGRILDYVRISVTDRCNFRCTYCMPSEGIEWISHEEIMSYEEMIFLCAVFVELGVKRIRFTGGEPFVRKGFVAFLGKMREAFPMLRMAITTNGALLEHFVVPLSTLALDSMNISLDTLDPVKFHEITRTGELSKVLHGIDALREKAIFPIKLNTVVMRNFNDKEISALVRFAEGKKLLLRFIEFMPLDKDVWSKAQYVPANEILSILPDAPLWRPCFVKKNSLEIRGPSRYYANVATGQMVGIISAVSNHFCAQCNRLRVTSRGVIRPCLFGNFGVSVMEGLRRKNRKMVREGIFAAVARKPQQGETGVLVRDGGDVFWEERHMSRIGG